MSTNWRDCRVVVTGLGVVSALGNDLETFWNQLVAGACGVDRIKGFDASAYDTQIAAEVKDFDPTPALPTPKEARRTDRFSQFGVHAGWQALRDSGLDLNRANRDEIGVFIGSGIGGLQTLAVHDPDAHLEHGLRPVLDVPRFARS
jgi:3-oxoacyl-[acyl-carrier-protein] synthase II